jgi:hypothetical protein
MVNLLLDESLIGFFVSGARRHRSATSHWRLEPSGPEVVSETRDAMHNFRQSQYR